MKSDPTGTAENILSVLCIRPSCTSSLRPLGLMDVFNVLETDAGG